MYCIKKYCTFVAEYNLKQKIKAVKNSILELQLKKILPFGQEIVFIIALGILLFGAALNASVSLRYASGIVMFCILLSLFICLIGQFFLEEFRVGTAIVCFFDIGLHCDDSSKFI